LQPALILAGSLKNTEGKPVTNAILDLILYQPDGRAIMRVQRATNINDLGTFSINALPKGARYALTVIADGYGRTEKEIPDNATRVDLLQVPVFVLRPANKRLAGVVLDSNNNPAPGVMVSVYAEGLVSVHAFATAEGTFLFDGICDGEVKVSTTFTSNGAGFTSEVKAHAGDTNVVIRLEPVKKEPAPNIRIRVPTRIPQAPISNTQRNPQFQSSNGRA